MLLALILLGVGNLSISEGAGLEKAGLGETAGSAERLVVFGEVIDRDDHIQVLDNGAEIGGFRMMEVRVEWSSVALDASSILIQEPEVGVGCEPLSDGQAEVVQRHFEIEIGEWFLFTLEETAQDVCGRLRPCGSPWRVWVAREWLKFER